jgi:MFS family permease
MAPFVLLAPVVGPLLDKIPHGRRAAMAGSMLARAALAVLLARAITSGNLALYPEALAVLVSSKAYGVVRSAIVPRLLPRGFPLVKAGSRVTLAGLVATGAAAPLGAGLHLLGTALPLYGAFAVFLLGAFLSFTLPGQVDSAKGERPARLASVRARRRPRKPLRTVSVPVRSALIANSAIRALSGLLLFFLAFLLRDQPLSGFSAAWSLGLVAGAAGGGNALGTALGAWLRTRGPEAIIAAALGCALAATVCATLLYGTVTVTLVTLTAGITQALGKLSLDALIQRDVPEEVRASAFARSETLMQMSWVLGGGLGIALPLVARFGMAAGAALIAVGALLSVRSLLTAAAYGTLHGHTRTHTHPPRRTD